MSRIGGSASSNAINVEQTVLSTQKKPIASDSKLTLRNLSQVAEKLQNTDKLSTPENLARAKKSITEHNVRNLNERVPVTENKAEDSPEINKIRNQLLAELYGDASKLNESAPLEGRVSAHAAPAA